MKVGRVLAETNTDEYEVYAEREEEGIMKSGRELVPDPGCHMGSEGVMYDVSEL
jgi:hypothetical protein